MAPSPPLPPELWNLAVVLTIGALFGWLIRVVQLMLTFADLRYAVDSNAVLYLRDLGTSLHVLKRASMWHFQQLLRTNVEASSTKMKRVEVPFDLLSSSLEIKRVNTTGTGSTTLRADSSNALSFRVRSNVPYSVQVLWSVRCESLDVSGNFSMGSSPASPAASILSPGRLIPPVLRRLSVDRTVRALRAAPASLSRIRRQRRRHELQDENAPHDDASELSPVSSLGVCGSPAFDDGDAASTSELFRCENVSPASAELFTVAVPTSAEQCPADELRSLIDEADSHSPTSPPRPPPSSSHVVASIAAARYSAVIVIRSLASGSARTNIFSKLGVVRDDKYDADAAVSAVCQCIALDFLPTPMKLERVSPVVVKKISYTKTAAYISQDIYGRDVAASSECTICLEGVLSVVLLPCRHLCVCRVCLDEIDRCPICRSTFTTWVCYDANSEAHEADNAQGEKTTEVNEAEEETCSPARGQLQAKMGSEPEHFR